jgi:hypothetical protein
VFQWLQQAGNVAEDEMWRVFNCGIGMVVVVAAAHAKAAADQLREIRRNGLRDRARRKVLGRARGARRLTRDVTSPL